MKPRSFTVHPFVFILAASFYLSSCASHSQNPERAFEGTITQTIHAQGLMEMLSKSGDSSSSNSTGAGIMGLLSNITLKLYVRSDKVAYDIDAAGGLLHMRSIIDRNTRTITTLMNHQALVTNLRSFDSLRPKIDDSLNTHHAIKDSLQNSLPQPTGKHQEINGFEADEYRAKTNGLDIDMWLTDDPRMKFYGIIRDAILGRNQTGGGGMEEIFSILAPVTGSKVPVRSTISMNGKQVMTSELSSIEEGKVDDAIFQIPKDYTIVRSDSIKALRRSVDSTDAKPDTNADEDVGVEGLGAIKK